MSPISLAAQTVFASDTTLAVTRYRVAGARISYSISATGGSRRGTGDALISDVVVSP